MTVIQSQLYGPMAVGGPPVISTDYPRPALKGAKDSWWATAVCRHESLSFAHIFKPCQFKHSRDFKAFKHKTWKSFI